MVSVKSLLQMELLVGGGVYALDLAHWWGGSTLTLSLALSLALTPTLTPTLTLTITRWGSSGLPLGEGGATPGGRGHAPTTPLVHEGVDQLRRSRAWWVRHPRLVNRSALDTGRWRTRCANFD